jgi:hypothetical protein
MNAVLITFESIASVMCYALSTCTHPLVRLAGYRVVAVAVVNGYRLLMNAMLILS